MARRTGTGGRYARYARFDRYAGFDRSGGSGGFDRFASNTLLSFWKKETKGTSARTREPRVDDPPRVSLASVARRMLARSDRVT
jgi:hypothetical protein